MYSLISRQLLSLEEAIFNATFYQDSGINDTEDGVLPCSSFSEALQVMHTYYIPFIVVVGFVGNILSTIVFLTSFLKMRSSSYYLAAMSVADFGFLFVVFIVHCSYNNIIDVFNRNGWCQIFVYLSSVFAFLSVWLIVAFTVERFIAIKYPLQRPHICTVARAKCIVLSITGVAMASQLHLFWVAGIITEGKKQECEMLPQYERFAKIVNFIDTFITLIFPMIIIVVMNVMIARSLMVFRSKLPIVSENVEMTSQSENSCRKNDDYKLNTQTSIDSRKSKGSKDNSEISSNMSTRKCKNRPSQTQQNINKMLLLISSVFIALNFPSYLIRLFVYFVYTLQEKPPPNVLWCAQQFTMLLYYTNFSINFLLYAMAGGTFRHCFCQLIKNIPSKLTSTHSN